MTTALLPVTERRTGTFKSVAIVWLSVLIALPIWIHFELPGWDVRVYLNAIHALQAGRDPYADATAVQRAFHAQVLANPALALHTDPPWSYVYSPITLPLLRLIGLLPTWFSGTLYWFLYAAAALAQVWVCFTSTEGTERKPFLYLASVAVFFPGFLANGIILSGNIAFPLYALVMMTAVLGWRRGRWLWFYLAVIAASCVKAPMLSLIAIAPLSARKQWIPAGLTAAVSLGLFALQPVLWPSLFRHYLEAVELQFSYNRDFGCSPAGLFGELLTKHGHAYAPGSYLFYLAYAVPVFATLLILSGRFLRGEFPLTRWIPILLLGVLLLNPRIQEYDASPIALLLALIVWRFFAARTTTRKTVIWLALLFAITNALASVSWDVHKQVDGPLLVFLFVVGAWDLLRPMERARWSVLAATS